MNTTSLRSRMIMYLAKYRNVDPRIAYGAPFDITQDGIANALGITRAYTSLVLSRLEKTSTVSHVNTQIRNSPTNITNRNVYTLTNQGIMEYETLVAQLEEEGLTPNDVILLDLNHCSTEVIFSRPEDELEIVGSLCVIRIPVERSELPEGSPKTVPFSIYNRMMLKEETRQRILEKATPEQMRMFHSRAADWCIDNDKDLKERLYHLVNAGRYREAAKVVANNGHGLIERADGDLVSTLTDLCMKTHDPVVCETAARMALVEDMVDEARTAVESSEGMDECVRESLMSEINLEEGNVDCAMSLALDCYRGDSLTGIPLGRCMMAEGRYEEAKVFLTKAMSSILESGYLFDLEKVLALKAEAAAKQGDRAEADFLVAATECVMKRKDTEADLDRIREILEGPQMVSEDRVGLQVV